MTDFNKSEFLAITAANRDSGKSVLLALLHRIFEEQAAHNFYLFVEDDNERTGS